MEDKKIKCIEIGCDIEFIFSKKDQEFYATMIDQRTGQKFVPPRRCPTHRAMRKAERDRQEKRNDLGNRGAVDSIFSSEGIL